MLVIGVCNDVVMGMVVVVAVVGYCIKKGCYFFCFRSAIVMCMRCHGGSGINWVVGMIVMMV